MFTSGFCLLSLVDKVDVSKCRENLKLKKCLFSTKRNKIKEAQSEIITESNVSTKQH